MCIGKEGGEARRVRRNETLTSKNPNLGISGKADLEMGLRWRGWRGSICEENAEIHRHGERERDRERSGCEKET